MHKDKLDEMFAKDYCPKEDWLVVDGQIEQALLKKNRFHFDEPSIREERVFIGVIY